MKHHRDTHIIKSTEIKQSKAGTVGEGGWGWGLNGDLKPEHKKTTNRTALSPNTDVDSQTSTTGNK